MTEREKLLQELGEALSKTSPSYLYYGTLGRARVMLEADGRIIRAVDAIEDAIVRGMVVLDPISVVAKRMAVADEATATETFEDAYSNVKPQVVEPTGLVTLEPAPPEPPDSDFKPEVATTPEAGSQYLGDGQGPEVARPAPRVGMSGSFDFGPTWDPAKRR